MPPCRHRPKDRKKLPGAQCEAALPNGQGLYRQQVQKLSENTHSSGTNGTIHPVMARIRRFTEGVGDAAPAVQCQELHQHRGGGDRHELKVGELQIAQHVYREEWRGDRGRETHSGVIEEKNARRGSADTACQTGINGKGPVLYVIAARAAIGQAAQVVTGDHARHCGQRKQQQKAVQASLWVLNPRARHRRRPGRQSRPAW